MRYGSTQKGGYAAVMGFASTNWCDNSCEQENCNNHTLEVKSDAQQFSTITEAVFWAVNEYSEYGVSIHPECEES
jgi:hypothetical protein